MTLALLALMSQTAAADELSAEIFLQATPSEQVATGVGLRLSAGSPFVAAEGFGYSGGEWLGRGTVGLDLLGSSEALDLTAGVFLGTVGNWVDPAMSLDVSAGLELGIGARVGPLHGRFRRVDGFRGPLEDRLTQNEVRVGWVFGDKVEVFGQYVNYTPRQDLTIDGFGAGANLRF